MKTRVEERLQTCFLAEARFPRASTVVCILDISKSGCLMRTDDQFAKAGATVVLKLAEDHYASGEIVRKLGTDCGVQFHRPLGDEIIDHIAARLE
jgi:hypothetical protein